MCSDNSTASCGVARRSGTSTHVGKNFGENGIGGSSRVVVECSMLGGCETTALCQLAAISGCVIARSCCCDVLLAISTASCEAAATDDSVVLIWCKIGYSAGAWMIAE